MVIPVSKKKALALSDKAKKKIGIVGPPAHYQGCMCSLCANFAILEEAAKRGKMKCRTSDKIMLARHVHLNRNPLKDPDYKVREHRIFLKYSRTPLAVVGQIDVR